MIYYPHYTPSKQKFRSILLFSDDISLVVPGCDQEAVQRRSNISDIFRNDHELIKFCDPINYSGWAFKEGANLIIENIVESVTNDMNQKGQAPLKKDPYGYALNGQDDEISRFHNEGKWKYIAVQKFPPALHDLLFSSAIAVRVGAYLDKKTGRVIENDGVLCHPELGDFILSRMARQASFVEGLPSITFGGIDFMNHLLDDEANNTLPEHSLIQSSLDLFVPDDLDLLSTGDYLSIRRDYEPVRKTFKLYLRDISENNNLNLPQSQGALLKNIERARDEIQKEFGLVMQQVGNQRFNSCTAFVMETATTIGSAALGAVLATPFGAMIASGIGLAGGKYAKRLSTINQSYDGRLHSIAMNKAKVERRGNQQRWNPPAYWK